MQMRGEGCGARGAGVGVPGADGRIMLPCYNFRFSITSFHRTASIYKYNPLFVASDYLYNHVNDGSLFMRRRVSAAAPALTLSSLG